MGVRLTSTEKKVALFCSTDGVAFGPVFDSEDDAQEFLDWFDDLGAPDCAECEGVDFVKDGTDPRDYTADGLMQIYRVWAGREPGDEALYNGPGVEGGIPFSTVDMRGEHDRSL